MSIQIFKGVQNQELVLKADYDKLAAECAALKESAADIRRQAFNGRRNSHNCGPFQYSDLCESIIDATNVETPNTDAAIADLKAQGVDLSANELKALAVRSRAEAPVAAEHIHSAALYLMTIAANLRAGVKP